MSSPTLPKLSLREVAVLVVLMAEARPIANSELKELAGFDLTGEARRNLNSLGYVSSAKVGRVLEHTLEEKGWKACRDLWSAPRPAGVGLAGGALFVLLAGVNRGLAANRLSPADFFVAAEVAPPPQPAPPPPPPPPAQQHTAARTPKATLQVVGDIEAQIRSAYATLAATPAGWVGLADLRAKLARLSRAEVDSALVRLAQSPGVRLIPVANLKSLTQRDRDAAIRIGGEFNHVIAIGAS